MALTIVASIEAVPEKSDLVKAALEKLIAPTLAEDGCLQYDLHQDNENPALFLFFENWTTRDAWQKHMQAPHITANSAATEGAIVSVTIQEMTKVG